MALNSFSALRKQTGLTYKELARVLDYSVSTLYRWENSQDEPHKLIISALNNIIEEKGHKASGASIKFIDLFAGIGGMRKGFEVLDGQCVYTSEWNKYSQETYLANFKCDHPIAGDITSIAANDIPSHDLLLAGFPCQPFSLAGVSKKNSLNKPHGFLCEAQGTLFFDVARIIDYHRPKAFLLENVKNLLSHDRGQTFKVIHRTLTEELGYQVHYRVIDARSWVPQHRERIFIVGFRDKNDFSFDDFTIPEKVNDPRLGSILHSEDGRERWEGYNDRFLEPDGKVLAKYTLSDKLWNYLQAYAEKHRMKGNGFGFSLFDRNDVARTLSARYHKDGSEILVRQDGLKNPRRLTPRECSRLMGFDKQGKTDFVISVSDAQAYRQFGNAVVVPVIEAVAKHMQPWLVDNVNRIISEKKLAKVG